MMSGAPDGGLGDALLAGGGHEHVVSERAQADAQDPQQGLVVVDGEDRGHSGHDHGDAVPEAW